MKEIPMLDLRLEYEYMKEQIDAAVARCLEHQKWIFGPEVKELEARMADYLGVRHCVGASSGTEALLLSLRALAITRKGEEYFDRTDGIITTPFTFTATGDAILRAGATPVFVDIDPVTCNIDTGKVRDFLASGVSHLVSPVSRIVGIIPVHLYGLACNMDEITEIAKEHDLFVVEDVAQAFGGRWKEKKLGSIGTTGAFSFFPSKNLGGFGDGGMVATDDDGVMELVRMLLKHGGRDKYNVDHVGYNARLDTLQAAVVLAKLGYVDEFNERRRKIADIYSEGLRGIKGLSLLSDSAPVLSSAYHVYHQYTVRTPNREELQNHLKQKGVSTMVYYPFPLHKMKVFRSRMAVAGSLEHSEAAAGEVLSLPMEPLMTDEQVELVVEALRSFFERGRSL